MRKEVILNGYTIKAKNFEMIDSERKKIKFVFDVNHDMYHDVTTLLYKNDFLVKVPEEALTFQAKISQYFTSVTDLYEKDAIGEFTLVLIEKA